MAWAAQQPAIRAALVAGSLARSVQPADEWADLDLEIFVGDFQPYFEDTAWLHQFGTLWVCLHVPTGDGDPQLLTVYDGGHKVDFTFFRVDELARLVDTQTLFDSQQRGYRVLLDKDGLATHLPTPLDDPPLPTPPAEDEFLATVNAFWFGAIYVAKQIRRRNLWVVKYRDWTMKVQLLTMLEWHAQIVHRHDTWHDGHFMPLWVDEATWTAIQGIFGHLDANDSWRALLATMRLFSTLAQATAQQVDYPYPYDLENNAASYIRQLQAEDSS